MRLGLIGLGRMGANMARRLSRGGHEVVVYNRTGSKTQALAQEEHVIPTYSLEEFVASLPAPRIVWLMVPAGQPTEAMLGNVTALLSAGDIIVDGGNANFNDSIRRGKDLTEKGYHFLDVGVSGGVWGLENGYSLMVGGEQEIADKLRPLFETLAPAPDRGWGYVGPHGAGHFVKMVHNGIEYGLMEAYAEGFEVLRGRQDMHLDLHQISEIWSYGSVVRSWLLELVEQALREDASLSDVRPWVADSGEGRWTVLEAINEDVPVPAIATALFRRFESRQDESYAAKLLASMRGGFGGHQVLKVSEEKDE